MSKAWINLIAILILSSSAFSQNFNKIYNENLKARGGKDNISSIKTYVYTGKIVRDDTFSVYFKVGYKLPDKYRIELYDGGDTLAFISDGKKTYAFMPQLSASGFELPSEKVYEMYHQMIETFVKLDSKLDEYKKGKYKFNISSKDSIDSIPQYKIICTKKDNSDIIFVSKNDSLVSRIVGSFTINDKESPAVIDISNYVNIEGIAKPKEIKIYNGEQILLYLNIDNIEINSEIPDEIFTVRLYE